MCGTEFTITEYYPASRRKAGKRVFCSAECRSAERRQTGAKGRMSDTARAETSRRMRERNPMTAPEARAKSSATLKRIGHRPPVRGGAGMGPTVPQKRLADALGWPMEVAIPTGAAPEAGGLPTYYAVDIANPELKVAVEVDGGSHFSLERQARDARQDTWLRGCGWIVLRFSNQEVMADTAACAQTVLSTTLRLRAPTSTE